MNCLPTNYYNTLPLLSPHLRGTGSAPTWRLKPLKRALVMFSRLLDPVTLAYMSLMPMSLHMVIMALWQCRPYPGGKKKHINELCVIICKHNLLRREH